MEKNCCYKKPCCSDPIENLDTINMSYAYCYVPIQKFRKLFEIDDVLKAGTLFKELYIPITEYGI